MNNQHQDGNDAHRQQQNEHAEEDDLEYGDFEGAEAAEEDQDDAPESEAIIANQPSLWAATSYPDLVPSSTNSTEDDTPEAQQGARQHPILQSHQISSSAIGSSTNHASSPAVSSGVRSASSSSACGAQNSGASTLRNAFAASSRDTGAIPKQPSSSSSSGSNGRFSRDLPDISNLSVSGAHPSCARRNAELDLTTSSNHVTPSSSAAPSAVGGNSSQRVTQLEREVLSLQTQKAVLEQQLRQRDLMLQASRQSQGASAASPPDVSSLADRLDRLQISLDMVTRAFDQRLNGISSQLPNLITQAVQSSIATLGPSLIQSLAQNSSNNEASLEASGGTASGASASSSTSSFTNETFIRNELHRFFEEQRRVLDEERRNYMLNLSEVFKNAATRRDDSKTGDKGPQ